MKPVRWITGCLTVVLFALAGGAQAAPYESRVREIDKETLAIDKSLAKLTKTTQDNCDPEACRAIDYFWGKDGRLRKMVEQTGSSTAPGSVIARFYSGCHLILVRIAPGDVEAARTPANIERYYFHKGDLLRVKFGADDKIFSKEQTAYYQRLLGKDPAQCRQTDGGKP